MVISNPKIENNSFLRNIILRNSVVFKIAEFLLDNSIERGKKHSNIYILNPAVLTTTRRLSNKRSLDKIEKESENKKC